MKLQVNPHITRLPMRLLPHMKRSLRRIKIQPFFHHRKVITQWIIATLQANIVRVETRHLVRGCFAKVAYDEGGLAGESVEDRVAFVAFFDECDAFWDCGFHSVVDFFADGFDSVGVVVGHFGVPLVLFNWFSKAISYTQPRQINMNKLPILLLNPLILLPNLMRNRRRIMPSITLPHHKQRIRTILRMRGIKPLQEVIRIFGNHLLVEIRRLAVTEPYAGGLVEPEDVGCFGPAGGVYVGGESVGGYFAGAVFGEECEGGGAAWTTG
mmetsp:Transcript_27508/g.32545  ORF Transcript_27508/g.32545 Transcript_27508/m.32545 type:complete len:268 (+) Transcript_27508:525-1328(+)